MPNGERTIADDALRACCVRIDIGRSLSGSGFFVAPGIVVTCHHVLKPEQVSSDEVSTRISIRTVDGRTYEVQDLADVSPVRDGDDLAILRVEPADDHPCVLIDTGLRIGDPLYTFGYPQTRPDGAPKTLENEGWLGDEERELQLRDGQVLPGMSGSPVVNGRTGCVAGIVRRTRDPRQPLGGYAVSARALIELSPPLDSMCRGYHRTHQDEWVALLPSDQRTMLERLWKGDVASTPPDRMLVLTLSLQRKQWQVKPQVHRRDGLTWHADDELKSIRVNLNDVRVLIARLFRDWASREASPGGRVAPGDQVRLLGEILSSALLREPALTAFEELLDDSEHGWFEVALHFENITDRNFAEFVELPWEHLYLPARGTRGGLYLAGAEKLALVRTVTGAPATPNPPEAGKLSVLPVLVTKPPEVDVDAQDVDAQDQELRRSVELIGSDLRGLGSADAPIEVAKPLESPGLGGLADAIAAREYTVLHYVGYGDFVKGTDRIALGGGSVPQTAESFAFALAQNHPQLVILELCRGSEAVPADLSVFGPTLLSHGGKAVIAYQYPVTDTLTRKFNDVLYGALADGVALERAVQDARNSIFFPGRGSGDRAWLSPALFTRDPGGLRLAPARRETAERPRVGAQAAQAGHA